MDSFSILLAVVCSIQFLILLWTVPKKRKQNDINKEIERLQNLLQIKNNAISKLERESEDRSREIETEIELLNEMHLEKILSLSKRIKEL